jgi:2-hydroxychromene-2-carboxylate isomerase
MTAPTIDFWFTMGSTYTYLTVLRLNEVEQRHDVAFKWRPFHLLVILNEMKHVPFADKPTKSAYMWRDIERRAAMYDVPFERPAPYPVKNSLFANLVATIGMEEGWGTKFVREAYRLWFMEKLETGSFENISSSLRRIGQDDERILAAASSDTWQLALTNETSRARDLGIFGSPTFAVGSELFWGDDRLEDAVSWLRFRRVSHDSYMSGLT